VNAVNSSERAIINSVGQRPAARAPPPR